jgi:hypothetical protein
MPRYNKLWILIQAQSRGNQRTWERKPPYTPIKLACMLAMYTDHLQEGCGNYSLWKRLSVHASSS